MRKSPTIIPRKGFLVVFHLKCPRVAPFLGERIDGAGEKVLNSRSFSMILPALVRIMRNLPLLQNLSPRAHPSLIQSPDNHSCPISQAAILPPKKRTGLRNSPLFYCDQSPTFSGYFRALGCNTDFLPVCTHAFSEFPRFSAKIQWIFHSVGIFDSLIHHVHP